MGILSITPCMRKLIHFLAISILPTALAGNALSRPNTVNSDAL